MESPTSTAERGPRAAMMTITTSRMAEITLFCRSESMERTSSEASPV